VDEAEAVRIAVLLDRLNRERKAIEAAMLEEALALAERQIEQNPDVALLLIDSEQFHKGVVGLVASRLVERFGRPACVIAWSAHGEGTGSLRSVSGLDIGAAVREAVAAEILSKGGGHAMAAGLTVKRPNLAKLAAFFEAKLGSSARAARAAASLLLDGALTPGSVNDELMALIDKAGPFGQGNPQPRFAFPAHRVKFAKKVGDAHVRCLLEAGDGSRLDAVAFRAAGQPLGEALLAGAGLPLHVAGYLRRDTWNGRNRRELVIEDLADPRQLSGVGRA
jgi:single-stranded-DNA-specific exonuclease